MVNNDSFEISKIERGVSLKKCLSADVMINQKNQEDDFVKAIFMMVHRFNNLVNVGKKLNEDQMVALANDLYERFAGESLDDVMLFFKMARNGDFGDFFRLDSVVVLGWVNQYLDLKIAAREEEIQNQRFMPTETAEPSANIVPPEKATEYLEQLAKRLNQAATARKTAHVEKDSPMFNYQLYLAELPDRLKLLPDKVLTDRFGNTSKLSHPEVWEMLQKEIAFRKSQVKSKKNQVK